MSMHLNPFKKFFWFLCGVDAKEEFQTLDGPYVSERRKYTSIGLAMVTMTCLTLFSFSYAFFQILYPNTQVFHLGATLLLLFCFLLAKVVTLIFLNLQRFVLTISNSVLIRLDAGGRRYASGFVGILLSAMMSIAVGVPLQTMILSPSIDASIYANRVSYDLKVDGYVQGRSNDFVNLLVRWDELGRDSEQKSELLDELPDLNPDCELNLFNCRQNLKTKLSSIENSLETAQTLTQVEKIKLQLENEMALMQLLKVEEKLKISQTSGFLYRSNVGFESEPFFSWLIILSVMFLQATPGITRMLSHPSVYDYAQIEIDRLAIASHGIELEADYVFDGLGNKIPVDKFHQAELVYKEKIDEVNLKSVFEQQQLNILKGQKAADVLGYKYTLGGSKES